MEMHNYAAKEAVRGLGDDLLIICGFAFDPSVSEEIKCYGKLTVLTVRMNPDLPMDELLKKTGAANLFMVFGEPDIDIQYQDGQSRFGTLPHNLLAERSRSQLPQPVSPSTPPRGRLRPQQLQSENCIE